MNSTKYLVVQTSLRPMGVVEFSGTDFVSTEVSDFDEFFATMAKNSHLKDTTILVNRGPGSYSGIRTGIAYIYGLLHGGLVDKSNIIPFTSFDLVRAATGHTGSIFLKAWPRIPSKKLEGSKGYFTGNTTEPVEYLYKTWEEIEVLEDLLVVSEEKIATEHEIRQYAEILKDPVGFRELVNRVEQSKKIFDPLYINPVHIT